MKPPDHEVSRLMRSQLSLITLEQAVAAGLTREQIRHRVRTGRWLRPHAGVFASAQSGSRDRPAAKAGKEGSSPPARPSREARDDRRPDPVGAGGPAMRLFRAWAIPVLERELHVGDDGRFRIDFLIADGLVVEVDGYVYHWSPEAKAYDDARRNRLRAAGMNVLVYDWRAIRREPGRVASEIRQALAHSTAAGSVAT